MLSSFRKFLPADVNAINITPAVWRQKIGVGSGNSFKLVQSLADLPSPVDNEILLDANTIYVFDGNIVTGMNTLVCAENTCIVGNAPALDAIIYTGTGDAIRCIEHTLWMDRISVVCVSGGDGVYFSDSTSENFLNTFSCAFIGCRNAVEIDGIKVAALNSPLFRNCQNGIIKGVTHSGLKILVNSGYFENTPSVNDGYGIKIGDSATLQNVDILDCFFESDSEGTYIWVDDPTTVTNTGTVFNCRFQGDNATFISGVDFSTQSWNLLNCDGIENTRINGQYGFSGNTTATTIGEGNQNQWIKVGIATTATLLSGFTHESPNTLTYIRRRSRVCDIGVSGALSSTANNVNVEIGIFVNNELSRSIPLDIRFSGQREPFSFVAQVKLQQNQNIDIRIRNMSGTQNLTMANKTVTAFALS